MDRVDSTQAPKGHVSRERKVYENHLERTL